MKQPPVLVRAVMPRNDDVVAAADIAVLVDAGVEVERFQQHSIIVVEEKTKHVDEVPMMNMERMKIVRNSYCHFGLYQ